MLNLARGLIDYDPDLLEIIASLWDLDLAAHDRSMMAEELAIAMLNAESVRDTWERLSDEERAALNDLLINDGCLLFSHFTRRYGELRPMGPARREREKPWLNPENVTEALYYHGMIQRAFLQTDAGAQEHIIIPSDLIDLLPESARRAVSAAPGHAVAPPRFVVSESVAADDMATLIGFLRLRETNAREWLALERVERLDRHLCASAEPAYRAMLTQLAYDLRLIHDQEVLTHIVTEVDKEAVRPWLEAPRQHQLRSLTETWMESVTWNDLACTPGLETDTWPNDPRLARLTVIEYLKQVPSMIWWSLDSFVQHIKKMSPDFQRPGGDYGAWYLRDAHTNEILHGFEYWNHIEGALIRFIIEGPLYWLGLVQAGRGAFMLTDLGLALLGRLDWPSQPDGQARISIDEQGVIAVPRDISRYDRVQIARFASWVRPPDIRSPHLHNGIDRSNYLYRLTPQAIKRVEREKISLPVHIIPFLQRLAGRDLPPNVLKMLHAWHERPEEVVVEDVIILRAKNLVVYQQLRTNKRVNSLLGEPIGPQAHAVKRENMPALFNALRELGLLPLFEGHEKDDWP